MGQRLKLAFFKDPDGISVEFVHWRESYRAAGGTSSVTLEFAFLGPSA